MYSERGDCVFMLIVNIVIAAFVETCVFLSHIYTPLFCFVVCKVEPRGLIARRVTEVAQSTLDMVTTAVDYPICECSCITQAAAGCSSSI